MQGKVRERKESRTCTSAAAKRSYPAPEVRGDGPEELLRARSLGQRLRGATLHLRSGVVAESSYPTSQVRSSG